MYYSQLFSDGDLSARLFAATTGKTVTQHSYTSCTFICDFCFDWSACLTASTQPVKGVYKYLHIYSAQVDKRKLERSQKETGNTVYGFRLCMTECKEAPESHVRHCQLLSHMYGRIVNSCFSRNLFIKLLVTGMILSWRMGHQSITEPHAHKHLCCQSTYQYIINTGGGNLKKKENERLEHDKEEREKDSRLMQQ